MPTGAIVPYATRSDIEQTYGAQRLETLVASDLDMDVAVARALDAATAEINLYLGKRYALPLALPAPPLVLSWCVDLACWKLAGSAAQNSDELTKRAERVLKMLQDVAAGKVSILELEPPPGGGAGSGSGGIPSGEFSDQAQSGAAFSSDRRRYGQGGGL
jgi:phage gp36-like protein